MIGKGGNRLRTAVRLSVLNAEWMQFHILSDMGLKMTDLDELMARIADPTFDLTTLADADIDKIIAQQRAYRGQREAGVKRPRSAKGIAPTGLPEGFKLFSASPKPKPTVVRRV